MRDFRKPILGLLAIAGVSLGLSRCVAADATDAGAAKPARQLLKPTDLFGDAVVAKGKGVEVKRSALDDEVIRLKTQATVRGRTISSEESTAIEKQVLDQLIQIQLIGSKATPEERTAGKETAEKRLQEAETQLGSEDAFRRRLKAEGVTREQLLAKWTDAATAEAAIKRELNAKVSDEDAKKYYEDNPAKFEAPEMVRVSHILFSIKDTNDVSATNPAQQKDLPEQAQKAKKKLAEDVLKRVKAGEDFTKLAREYSEDPGVKQNNGEYKFSRDDQFVPEFKAAAFSLDATNNVSDIVTTMFGYHIIKFWERIPAKKEPFAGADTKTIFRKQGGENITIKEILQDEALRKEFPAYIKRARKEAGVEVLDPNLKPDETADAAPAVLPPKTSSK